MAKGSDPSIEPIREAHRRDTFDSGEPDLDEYLRKYARQNHERGVTTTFVAVRNPDPTVLGYFSIRMGSVSAADFPPEDVKRLPRYPVPVVHLARLATDRRVQGQGLGELLLISALQKAQETSKTVAAFAVEAIALSEKAKAFYLRYGFKTLRDDPLHLYISMKTVSKLF